MPRRATDGAPSVYELEEDFDAWLEKVEDILCGVESGRRSICLTRLMSKPAAIRARRAGCKPDMPYESLVQKLRDTFVDPSDRALRFHELWHRRFRYGETLKGYVGTLYDMVSNVYRGESEEAIKQKTVKHVIMGLTTEEVRRYGYLMDRPLEEVEEILGKDPNLNGASPVSSHQRTWQPRGGQKFQPTRGSTVRRPTQHPPKPQSDSGVSASCPAIYASCLGSRPFISVGLCNRLMHFLVDTGAGCSLVNPRRFPRHAFDPFLVTSSIRVRAASGTSMRSDGCIDVPLAIAGSEYQHTLYLCTEMSYDGILGSDFLDRYAGEYSRPRGCLRLGSHEVPVAYEQKNGVIAAVTPPVHPTAEELDILIGTNALNEGSDRSQFRKVIEEFADVFAWDGDGSGRTSVIRHDIHTTETHPIRQRPRRIPVAYQQAVEEAIEEMLQKLIIKPSVSPWASPIVVVKKKDGSIRLCVDYRKLNEVTVKDSFPIPRMDVTLDALGRSTIFSTLDLKSGYWQVEINPNRRQKSAFVIPSGLYEFETMPFGLANAQATFQRLMNTVLQGLTQKECLVCMDDVIVHAKDSAQHLKRLRNIFERLRGAGLKLNPAKCSLLRDSVKFLGHIVSKEGIRTDPDKTDKVIWVCGGIA
ncbi:unnamed protein product [Mesocestoides corti]|uniref:Reverse transcriptase domain-containing protein n=1 Tax=Mesocestoides corti TaxID=53468 RepID=A0A0R3UBT5_MESCO|nr:unnamed protein product [Mesocestoides corti]